MRARVGSRLAAPSWEREGVDWPHREFSRFVELNGTRWHVQVMGEGPKLVLLHGAGASSHSFRELASCFAEDHQVIVPDLPGHGFTVVPDGAPLGLRAMARSVESLLRALEVGRFDVVGHSAGAAVAARLGLNGRIPLRRWIGINPALLPLEGWAGVLFAPAARAVAASSLLPRVLSWSSRQPDRVRRTIEGTGSRLDERGLELYERLVRCPGHVEGTVRMMAEWDLESLAEELESFSAPMLFVLGAADRAVPPGAVRTLAHRLPSAKVETLPGLGHLAHEEAPTLVATSIREFLELD